MKVGVLELVAPPLDHLGEFTYRTLLTKQFASIMPQAVSTWCRRAGHETFYSTYYGLGDPGRQLPADLDVVFLSCYTQACALAYALARKFSADGVLTVIGGPHAEAFPADCSRFFDLVVTTCDEELVRDIVAGHFDPGSVIASARPLDDIPLAEERMPEIRRAALIAGRWRSPSTTVPMLASVGCPYRCSFCIDWNRPYRPLPLERLQADLRYISRELPGALLAFADPNFGIRFDEVLDAFETTPPAERNPYLIESSLSVVRGPRLRRLKETNCVFLAPGVESWVDFSNKARVGRKVGQAKVLEVAKHFAELHEFIPYLQANFIFGLDGDLGDEPVELTKDFMSLAPFAFPAINIPVPFGGTPLFDQHLAEGRILTRMPLTFYYAPYLVTSLKHYGVSEYYERLIELFHHVGSAQMLRRRLASASSAKVWTANLVRTLGVRASTRKRYGRILTLLRENEQFRAFHERESETLPPFYQQQLERLLGRYSELLAPEDHVPLLYSDRSVIVASRREAQLSTPREPLTKAALLAPIHPDSALSE